MGNETSKGGASKKKSAKRSGKSSKKEDAAPAEVEPAKVVKPEPVKVEEPASDDDSSEGYDSEDETDPAAVKEMLGEEATVYSKEGTSQKVTKDDFELLTVIGKGSFGKVMQVRNRLDGKIYAMKVLRKEAIIARKQVAHTKAERSILQKISHPFIVKLNYAFQTDDKLYMILDYVNGGELFFHLKREGKFSEARVQQYAAEIASAIAHLHSFGIVYRDLKPENILLDTDGHIVITDFGLSKEIPKDGGTHTFCGTPEYLAPEVLKGKGHGTAVDWWSLGTLVYEMLTGLPPFYSQNINIMYQKILNGELRFPATVSDDAQDFLSGLLTRDVSKRLGSNGFDEIKEHPFFEGLDWDALLRRELETEFKPDVTSQLDVSQIDPVFTAEKAVDSLVESSAMSDALQDEENAFDGFTFVAESALNTGA